MSIETQTGLGSPPQYIIRPFGPLMLLEVVDLSFANAMPDLFADIAFGSRILPGRSHRPLNGAIAGVWTLSKTLPIPALLESWLEARQ